MGSGAAEFDFQFSIESVQQLLILSLKTLHNVHLCTYAVTLCSNSTLQYFSHICHFMGANL